MAMGCYGATLLSYSFKPFGESSSTHDPISDELLTWGFNIGAGLVNGLSRVVFGNLSDKFSFKAIMTILLTMELLSCLVFYWAATVPWFYFICIMVNYAMLGGFFTILPVSVTKVFGLELGASVYV